MKCFIHNESEAIATCKKCGKAMCAKCSAYSGHSGICPECRRDEFIAEVKSNNVKIKELKWDMAKNIIWTVLLCWTVIAIPINLVKFFNNMSNKNKLNERNTQLNAEIPTLTKSLNDRGGVAFV